MIPALNRGQYSIAYLVFLLLLGVALLPIIDLALNPIYITWSDREMLRATTLFENFQAMGVENNGTYYGRAPGGALYYFLALITLFTNDPDVVSRTIIILTLVACALFYQATRQAFGHMAAVAGLIVLISAPIGYQAGFRLYNPSIGFVFAIAAYYLFVHYLRGEQRALPWLAFVICIAAQAHISFAALFLTMGPAILVLKRPSLKCLLIAIFVIVGMYTPYLIEEIINGFANTGLYITGRDEVNPIWTALKTFNLESFVYHLLNPICPADIAQCSHSSAPVGHFDHWRSFIGLAIIAIAGYRAALAATRLLGRSAGQGFDRENERLIGGLGIILAIGVLLILIGRGFAPGPRFYAFMLPAAAIITGSCIASSLNFFSSQKTPIKVSGSAFVILAFVFAYGGPIDRLIGPTPLFSGDGETAAQSWTALGQRIHDLTGMDHEDIKGRAALISADGNLKELHISYLLRTVAPSRDTEKFVGAAPCLAVIEETNSAIARQILDDFVERSQFQLTEPVRFLGSDQDHVMLGYGLENDNCFKSIGNSYDHLPQEAAARRQCDMAEQDGVVWQKVERDTFKAVVRDTYDRSRICFWIDGAIESSALNGSIYAWQWRNYSGYTVDHLTLKSLDLVVSNNGAPETLHVTNLPLGRPVAMRLPWHFRINYPMAEIVPKRIEYDLIYFADQWKTHATRDAAESEVVHRASLEFDDPASGGKP